MLVLMFLGARAPLGPFSMPSKVRLTKSECCLLVSNVGTAMIRTGLGCISRIMATKSPKNR